MVIVSLIFSTIALCFCVFLLLERLGKVVIVEKKDDKKSLYRDPQTGMLNKSMTPPESRVKR